MNSDEMEKLQPMFNRITRLSQSIILLYEQSHQLKEPFQLNFFKRWNYFRIHFLIQPLN